MSAVEIGLAVNIAINLGALGYMFGSVGARVKRNEADIGQITTQREADKGAVALDIGRIEGTQDSGHRRLRADLSETVGRVIRLEALANGKKVKDG